MRTLYVKGDSKKEVNKRLDAGLTVQGVSYSPWGDEETIASNNWQAGDVVKVYSKTVGGNPYAKAYGTVKITNGKVNVK